MGICKDLTPDYHFTKSAQFKRNQVTNATSDKPMQEENPSVPSNFAV